LGEFYILPEHASGGRCVSHYSIKYCALVYLLPTRSELRDA
jgi:hypothetical protein